MSKKGENATRPVTKEEYQEIMNLIKNGFITKEGKTFRPNPQLALILQLQATLGLRVGDILELEINNFKNGKLETREQKTGKLQYRDINPAVSDKVKDYYIHSQNKKTNSSNKSNKSNKIFKINIRTVQQQLKIVCEHLDLKNISTHSFRKLYADIMYHASDKDIYIVKELLNHSSISTTQRYIKVDQAKMNKLSSEIDLIN